MTQYFSSDTQRAEGDVGRYGSIADAQAIEAAPGVTLRPLLGQRVMLSHVSLEPHSEAELHTHGEEQMGIVLEGSCEFELDGEVRMVGPGDTYHAPPGVPHGCRTSDERCVILDIFAPPRAMLVELMRAADD